MQGRKTVIFTPTLICKLFYKVFVFQFLQPYWGQGRLYIRPAPNQAHGLAAICPAKYLHRQWVFLLYAQSIQKLHSQVGLHSRSELVLPFKADVYVPAFMTVVVADPWQSWKVFIFGRRKVWVIKLTVNCFILKLSKHLWISEIIFFHITSFGG